MLKEIKMKVKGTGKTGKVINSESALEFANTIRGQYIISQALTYARNFLFRYERGKNKDLRHAEPSNRADMDYLLEAFPLFKIHDIMDEELSQTEQKSNAKYVDESLLDEASAELLKSDKMDRDDDDFLGKVKIE